MLLHGWGRSLSDFDAFCALVSKMPSPPWVVRFDLPGFGSSPLPGHPIGSKEYAQLVRNAIDEVAATIPRAKDLEVIVVGHSFGGRVAISLDVVSESSYRISALLLSGVPLLRLAELKRRPKLSYRIAKRASRFGLISAERMEKSKIKHGSRDYREAQGVMRDIFVKVVNEDYDALLRKVSLPVSLLWGRHDTAAPVEVAERAVDLAPEHISLKIVDGDHFVVLTSPAILLESMTDLIQRIEH